MEATFTSSEWTEIGYLTAIDEYIDRRPRLLRSLAWGDSDYKKHVFDAVARILNTDPQNLRRLFAYPPIAAWLEANELGPFAGLMAETRGLEVPEIIPATSTDTGYAALADAQALLRSRGAASAVDRVHTGLHAFFKAACEDAGIALPAKATPNQMLELLIDDHPALQAAGTRTQDVKRILRTAAAIVDAMGTIRNQASLAHPNEALLDNDEALLVINIARSLMRFLDAKLSPPR